MELSLIFLLEQSITGERVRPMSHTGLEIRRLVTDQWQLPVARKKCISRLVKKVVAGRHQVKSENFKVKVVPCHSNQHVKKGKTFTLKVNSLPFSLHFTFNSFTSTLFLQQLTGDQIDLKEVSGAALYSF